jgi:iron complex outermembrane receptor protein
MSKNPMSKNPLKNNKKLFKLLPIAFVVMTSFEAIAQSNETSIEVTADKVSEGIKNAPSQASLDSRMPQTSISEDFLKRFISPTASFVEALSLAPSVVGLNQNGPGLNDNKVSLRGFNNGQFTMRFDGIPINDTNGVSYHSTIWAPTQFLGSASIDRSPGLASTFGPANYGGGFDLYSKSVSDEKGATLYGSVGSWNTFTYGADLTTGKLGEDGATKIAMGVHRMSTDGYMTNDSGFRNGGYFKLESDLTKDVKLTAFASAIQYFTAGPDGLKVFAQDTNPALAGINPNYKGQNYFASKDPTRLDSTNLFMIGGNGATTDVRTYLNYIGLSANLGNGWKVDNKIYNMSYNNQDMLQQVTAPNQVVSGTGAMSTSDLNWTGRIKKNSFQKFGDILTSSFESDLGIFRTGMWYEASYSSRYGVTFNPLTGVTAPVGAASNGVSYAENYMTQLFQPFVEFEWKVTDKLKITPGFKYSLYNMSLSQNPDNGPTTAVGTSGKCTGYPTIGVGKSSSYCGYVGNQSSPALNNATYNQPLPFLDMHYMIQPNWSTYAQFATGNVIPDTGVYDTAGAAAPIALPTPIQTKAYQVGTVYKTNRLSLDADAYIVRADNSVSLITGTSSYYSSGSTTYSGLEAQATYDLGSGFTIYGNASKMSAIVDSTGYSAPLVPTDMEALGLFYRQYGWSVGATVKRIGTQYVDNSKATTLNANGNEWAQLDPIFLTGLYMNYEFNNLGSFAKSARIRFGVDNVFDKIYLTSYTPAGVSSDPNRPGTNLNTNTLNNDIVTWSSGRFTSVSLFVNF